VEPAVVLCRPRGVSDTPQGTAVGQAAGDAELSVQPPRPDANELRVRLRADLGRRGGLSEVLVGPMTRVGPLAERQVRWRVALPQAASVFSLMVAFFLRAAGVAAPRSALRLGRARRERCGARGRRFGFVEAAPLPWPAWGYTLVLLRALWLWTLYAIAQQVFGRAPRAERRALIARAGGNPAWRLAATAAQQSVRPLRIGHFVLGLVMARGDRAPRAAGAGHADLGSGAVRVRARGLPCGGVVARHGRRSLGRHAVRRAGVGSSSWRR
jgi:hypothetical protein